MGHTFSNLLIHVVFGTKDRRPLLVAPFRERLFAYLGGIAREEFGQAIQAGGTENHAHVLIRIGTDVSVAQAVNRMKSLSSGWAHRTIPELRDFAWQAGYGAFSVSRSNVGRVAAYIRNQEAHHRTRTFEEEFVAFLRRHDVAYDGSHVWD